jgi:oxalate decarboxylase/phosphoglucose isomerase-like protein (cupin superfamily)
VGDPAKKIKMQATTQIKRQSEMLQRPLSQCHDGKGSVDWTEVLNYRQPDRLLRYIHDDTIPPGASIGVHRHEADEEYYYIISGEGEMILDGETHTVSAGDITAVFPGGSHALINTGQCDLRVLVINLGR